MLVILRVDVRAKVGVCKKPLDDGLCAAAVENGEMRIEDAAGVGGVDRRDRR